MSILPVAMTADDATVAPRKRRWKGWAIGLAVVVAAATIALLSTAPKPEPVRVWFVRATNEGGVKRLVFEGTNGTTGAIQFYASIYRGATPRWKDEIYRVAPLEISDVRAEAGTSVSLTLQAPEGEVPYRVVWMTYRIPRSAARWERFRWGCCAFLSTHGMSSLAELVKPTPHTHTIPSTSIKE